MNCEPSTSNNYEDASYSDITGHNKFEKSRPSDKEEFKFEKQGKFHFANQKKLTNGDENISLSSLEQDINQNYNEENYKATYSDELSISRTSSHLLYYNLKNDKEVIQIPA